MISSVIGAVPVAAVGLPDAVLLAGTGRRHESIQRHRDVDDDLCHRVLLGPASRRRVRRGVQCCYLSAAAFMTISPMRSTLSK
jgi:hypothetical protein